jgi:hypothetical protein
LDLATWLLRCAAAPCCGCSAAGSAPPAANPQARPTRRRDRGRPAIALRGGPAETNSPWRPSAAASGCFLTATGCASTHSWPSGCTAAKRTAGARRFRHVVALFRCNTVGLRKLPTNPTRPQVSNPSGKKPNTSLSLTSLCDPREHPAAAQCHDSTGLHPDPTVPTHSFIGQPFGRPRSVLRHVVACKAREEDSTT